MSSAWPDPCCSPLCPPPVPTSPGPSLLGGRPEDSAWGLHGGGGVGLPGGGRWSRRSPGLIGPRPAPPREALEPSWPRSLPVDTAGGDLPGGRRLHLSGSLGARPENPRPALSKAPAFRAEERKRVSAKPGAGGGWTRSQGEPACVCAGAWGAGRAGRRRVGRNKAVSFSSGGAGGRAGADGVGVPVTLAPGDTEQRPEGSTCRGGACRCRGAPRDVALLEGLTEFNADPRSWVRGGCSWASSRRCPLPSAPRPLPSTLCAGALEGACGLPPGPRAPPPLSPVPVWLS